MRRSRCRGSPSALLATLADADWPEREGAWTSNATLHRLGWGWAPLIGARLERPEQGERMLFSRLKQWEEAGRAAAAAHRPGRSRRRPRAKLDQLTGPRRAARGPAGDGRGGDAACSRPSAPKDVAQPAAGRGRDRDRQDARLSRAGVAVGRSVGRDGVGVDLHQGAAAPARRRRAASCSPTPASARAGSSSARAARIICACSTSRTRCRARSPAAPRSSPSWSGAGRLIPRTATWSAATCPAGCRACSAAPGAAALTDRRGECVYAGCPHYRRCFIERAERASREADIVIANHALGDGQRRPRRARTRRRGSCSTRAITCSTPPIRSLRSTFGGQEAIELRRWIVGPEGRSRGRRRGLAARLMDVASYDDEGARALDAAVEAARALPSDGWLQRLVEGAPFGPVEALLAEVRGMVYARAKAQEAGYGLETELAEPDGALVSAAAAALEVLEALQKPLAALGRRLEAVLEDAPDWLDSQARARVEGAIRGLVVAARDARGVDRLAGADRRRGRSRNSSTGWRSSGSTGANMTSRSTAAGSTRPSRSPAAVLAPADGVLVTSATLARRRGLGRGRSAHRRGASARAGAAISRPRARSIMPPARKC